jgi:nitroreductase
MELRDAVRRRRMVRRFDPTSTVDAEVVRDLVALAVRAPSAGFSQGWDFLCLADPGDRATFWAATRDPGQAEAWAPDDWWTGVSAAPVLVLCLSDPGAYLDRYAQPDKGWDDRSPDRWPVPYWDTDTAMAAMILLLGAEDRGLGALFFGVPGARHDAVRRALDIPAGRRIVGVVALGREAERVSGSARTRRRRGVEEVLHTGRFGASGQPPATGA